MTRQEYIKKILETYKLVNTLSDKNGCKVLRLRHKDLHKDMVLHSLPTKNEIYEVLCNIKAPNLPEIYDCINMEDGQIVLEEYIDGLNVTEVMESGKYTYSGASEILKNVSDALSVLHSHRFVHRDIKPENIMIRGDGTVFLIDFNASRKISAKSRDTEVMGTVGYASPEQMGIAQTDERTDIYAMGILLNVMLTGKHPSERLASGKARNIIKKCTALNPKERYQTAEKLKKVL